MSSQPLQFVFLSSLSLSLLIGNSVAFAQTDGVVVPTVPSGSSTTVPSDSSTSIPTSTTVDSSKRFSCQYYNGQYTVMYQPQSQPGQFFAWAAPQSLGGGWTPKNRCEAIASRLELYRPDGLQELQIAVENNENIICVTTEANPNCRIVLTVPRGKDPYAVRSSVFNNIASADEGQQTIAVNTYANRNQSGTNELYNLGRSLLGGGNNRVSSAKNGINLKPFLDPKDGGTASKLQNGVSLRRQSQPQNRTILNPRLFR
ncbi:COP23 domain-containing protein [Sphaerospermopsis aphanizomenoides BCCUSP55]|uniref:COP23 domain-containing protein n=1 Tax=Sphaerospermopsis aphanizomenoides TaxID=459663 RepID=UPI0019033BD7|nr:COP23 domain-containing protein [Sphaerospermopsis aphanizomenoides]MBK1986060.1 COP23 domain-containing protein [Sphaerospermopsis aphanizomenoides BCCUSP55]